MPIHLNLHLSHKPIKWFFRIMISLGLIILAMFLAGSALPEKHEASVSRDFSSPPDTVWAVLSDFKDWPTWRSDLKEIRLGHNSFTEVSASGEEIDYRIEEFSTPERLVTRIATPDLHFGGAWTYEISSTDTGCRLTITEEGEVYNPVFRLISRYVIGHTATMEKCLSDLGKKVK